MVVLMINLEDVDLFCRSTRVALRNCAGLLPKWCSTLK